MRILFPTLDAALSRVRLLKKGVATLGNGAFVLGHSQALATVATACGYQSWFELKHTGITPSAPSMRRPDRAAFAAALAHQLRLSDEQANFVFQNAFGDVVPALDASTGFGAAALAAGLSRTASFAVVDTGYKTYTAVFDPGVDVATIAEISEETALDLVADAFRYCESYSSDWSKYSSSGRPTMSAPFPLQNGCEISIIPDGDRVVARLDPHRDYYADPVAPMVLGDAAVPPAILEALTMRPLRLEQTACQAVPYTIDLENLLCFTPWPFTDDQDEDFTRMGELIRAFHLFEINGAPAAEAAFSGLSRRTTPPPELAAVLRSYTMKPRQAGVSSILVAGSTEFGDIQGVAAGSRSVFVDMATKEINYTLKLSALYISPENRGYGLSGALTMALAHAAGTDLSDLPSIPDDIIAPFKIHTTIEAPRSLEHSKILGGLQDLLLESALDNNAPSPRITFTG